MASRRQISLWTLIVFITLFCILASMVGLKLRQDRRRNIALFELQRLGFRSTIGTADDSPAIWLRYTKPEFHGGVEDSLRWMHVLTNRHDVGMSQGLQIQGLDFTGCRVPDDVNPWRMSDVEQVS